MNTMNMNGPGEGAQGAQTLDETDTTTNPKLGLSAARTSARAWAARAALTVLGVAACAAPSRVATAGHPLRTQAGGYEIEVIVDGVSVPTFAHAGESYVLGRLGDRYVLRVRNHTGRRIEAVVSVDGRDVIDGKGADFARKRGYLVPAYGWVDIDGWRLSDRQAAAFRFSSVADSYAARTGRAREVGVIGVAVFPERVHRPRPQPWPYQSYPHDYRSFDGQRGLGGASKDEAMREPERLAESRDDARAMRKSAPEASAPAPTPASAPPPVAADSAVGRSAKGLASSSRGEAEARGFESGAALERKRERPGLGTEFGEAVTSHIREVQFVRAHSTQPAVVLGARYNDRQGLLALGIDVDGWYYSQAPDRMNDTYLRRSANPFPVSQRRYSNPPPGWSR